MKPKNINILHNLVKGIWTSGKGKPMMIRCKKIKTVKFLMEYILRKIFCVKVIRIKIFLKNEGKLTSISIIEHNNSGNNIDKIMNMTIILLILVTMTIIIVIIITL